MPSRENRARLPAKAPNKRRDHDGLPIISLQRSEVDGFACAAASGLWLAELRPEELRLGGVLPEQDTPPL